MRTFFPRQFPSRVDRERVSPGGFTLIELLVTVVIAFLILITLVEFLGNAERVWKTTAVDPFVEAQDAFETIVDRLSGATLDPAQDYVDANGAFRTAATAVSFVPDHLARRSDLAFACGPSSIWISGSGRITASDAVFFIAPHGYTQTDAHLGLDRLLNALGYFVEFSDESSVPAFILPGTHRWRWRLKQIVQPSESLAIYQNSMAQAATSLPWAQACVQSDTSTSILAENVAALFVLPERAASDPDVATPISPDFDYDSRNAGNALTYNQLPARLRLAVVAINETSAQILASRNGAQPPALVPSTLFTAAAQMDADLATLDQSLSAEKIQHRILQREILLPAAAWINPPATP